MGFVDRVIPTTVSPDEGGSVPTTLDGFQHWFYELPSAISASEVRLRFRGAASSRRVYALMLLEEDIHINANRDYSRIIPHRDDRTGRLHRNPRGGVKRVKPIGADRQKWELDFSVMFVPGIQPMTAKEFLSWMEANLNFVFARE